MKFIEKRFVFIGFQLNFLILIFVCMMRLDRKPSKIQTLPQILLTKHNMNTVWRVEGYLHSTYCPLKISPPFCSSTDDSTTVYENTLVLDNADYQVLEILLVVFTDNDSQLYLFFSKCCNLSFDDKTFFSTLIVIVDLHLANAGINQFFSLFLSPPFFIKFSSAS